METKQIICLETVKNDAKFVFMIPNGTTWGSALDAAFEILNQIAKMSQENIDSMKPETKIES